jgi:thiamine-monophosphate kinase
LKLRELGEFGLIERIAGRVAQKTGITIGIGDDAAAIEPTAGLLTLVTADMLVEGVHFDPALCDPVTLGRKSLAVNLSDIAAMGGRPRHFLLSLAIPGDLPVEFLDGFITGMLEMGDQFGVTLIGGDTCSSPAGLVISVTVMGEQVPDLIVRRGGAQAGDLICVTGTLGDAALGLALLKAGVRDGVAVTRHLDPTPRVREGLKLAGGGIPSAMIDISDGLLADLGHILDLSGVGARLYLDKLPLSDYYLAQQAFLQEDLYLFPLSGGEDYELLFTVPPARLPAVQSTLAETGTRTAVIGEVTATGKLVVFRADGTEYPAVRRGYNHFSGDN